jgi:hypothetical protein
VLAPLLRPNIENRLRVLIARTTDREFLTDQVGSVTSPFPACMASVCSKAF